MLLIQTEIRPCAHGLGCFALVDVRQDDEIWRLDPKLDRFLLSIDGPYAEFLEKYAYRDIHTSLWILCADNARFINHSDTPNLRIASTPEFLYGADYAARDIRAGEELTISYDAIHNGSWKKTRTKILPKGSVPKYFP